MNEKLYKGISFRNYTKNKNIHLTDLALIEADLINHIHTKRGEKRKHPAFGTIIPDVQFAPLTEALKVSITSDIEEVFNYDPRVQLLEILPDTIYEEKTMIFPVRVRYVELNLTNILALRIEL